jgi:hypothetical protein
MPTDQKETPDCGCNHGAGVNTQNEPILCVLSMLERIAKALEASNDLAHRTNQILDNISDSFNER